MRILRIMGGPAIPWAVIAPHEDQARSNHDQSLEELHGRGGLSPFEALCVLRDLKYGFHRPNTKERDDADRAALEQIVKDRCCLAENDRLRAALLAVAEAWEAVEAFEVVPDVPIFSQHIENDRLILILRTACKAAAEAAKP